MTLPTLTAGLPLVVALTAIFWLRAHALAAAALGIGVAFALAGVVPAFALELPAVWDAAIGSALTAVPVALVLLGGLLLHQVLERTGALQAIGATLARALPDAADQALVLTLGVGVFMEAITGFGVGIVVVAPVLLALGYSPRQAALLALLGMCAVPWGALGIGSTLGAELAGQVPEALVLRGWPLTVPFVVLTAWMALWIAGGGALLQSCWKRAFGYAGLLLAALAVLTPLLGLPVSGAVASLGVIGVGWLRGRRAALAAAKRGDSVTGANPPGFVWAITPLLALIGVLIATQSVPAIREPLASLAVWTVPGHDFALAWLTHPGTWVIAAAGFGAVWLRLPRAECVPALMQAVQRWTLAAGVVLAFLMLSSLLSAFGMNAALATALSEGGPVFYAVCAAFLGAVGGYLTATNAGANAVFMPLHAEVARSLGVPLDTFAAAQNTAGANATLASPGRIALAAGVVGLNGQERTLMGPTLALVAAGTLFTGVGAGGWMVWRLAGA